MPTSSSDKLIASRKNSIEPQNGNEIRYSNSRNGYMSKTLKGSFGELTVQTPRDRKSTFEPILVRKSQTRFTAFDDQIIALYARGIEVPL